MPAGGRVSQIRKRRYPVASHTPAERTHLGAGSGGHHRKTPGKCPHTALKPSCLWRASVEPVGESIEASPAVVTDLRQDHVSDLSLNTGRHGGSRGGTERHETQ